MFWQFLGILSQYKAILHIKNFRRGLCPLRPLLRPPSSRCTRFTHSNVRSNEIALFTSRVFNGIMSKIKKIDDDWLECSKDYMKIRFSSDDNLPLNKPLKFYNMTVTIRCVFSEDNKLDPQVFLNEALLSL